MEYVGKHHIVFPPGFRSQFNGDEFALIAVGPPPPDRAGFLGFDLKGQSLEILDTNVKAYSTVRNSTRGFFLRGRP